MNTQMPSGFKKKPMLKRALLAETSLVCYFGPQLSALL
jgi:hypothetical protein